MRQLIAIVVLATSLVACKREPPPAPPNRAPAPAQRTPDVGVPQTVAPIRPESWSIDPPHPSGARYELERADGQLRIQRESITLVFEEPDFSDCLDQITAVEEQTDMPLQDVEEHPVWLALRGGGEAASVRLSTRGAMLVIDDGCLRTADITPELLGTIAGDDDPLFAAPTLSPDSARPAEAFTLSLTGVSGAVVAPEHTIEINVFEGESVLRARTLGETTWARVTTSYEVESEDGESARGREHTFVWRFDGADDPFLRLENDFRFVATGADRERTWVTSTWRQPSIEGVLSATAERRAHDDALNVGAGRCPEMEGVLAFRHHAETAQWTFHSHAGQSYPIGLSKRTATFASGCLDEARKEIRRVANRRLSGVPAEPATWKISR